MQRFHISMENYTPDPQIQVEEENELVFYAKIGDPKGLLQAFEAELQIQAEIKQPSGRIRVRKTTPWKPGLKGPAGPDVYELTTKHKLADGAVRSELERTTPITRQQFNQFVSVCPLYQSKARYCFRMERLTLASMSGETEVDVDGLKYEVDVYDKANGKRSVWCKIDLEVNGLAAKLREIGLNLNDLNLIVKISKLPFLPYAIVVDDRDGNADKMELISKLYQSEFLKPVPEYYRLN